MADPRTPSASSARPRARKPARKAAVEPTAPPVVAPQEPIAGKPAVAKPAVEMTPIDRDQMIATAAYFRAANRQFQPGHELEDWLSAEREIDALLKQPAQTAQ